MSYGGKLAGLAKQKFDQIIERHDLIDDLEDLEVGCWYWAEWWRLAEKNPEERKYDNNGKVLRTNPEVRYMKECWTIWSEVSKGYGLNPVDANKLVNRPSSKRKSGSSIPLRMERVPLRMPES